MSLDGPLGFSQNLYQKPVVLDQIKVADGDQVSGRLLVGMGVHWRHEVADDRGGHDSGLGKPTQDAILC